MTPLEQMDDNHIGAVIVHDGETLVGIVTDRDLAMHVVGGDLDSYDVELRDLVSTPPVAIPVNANEADAARLMLNHHLRRLPIVDGSELVGLVTLDDRPHRRHPCRTTEPVVPRDLRAHPGPRPDDSRAP